MVQTSAALPLQRAALAALVILVTAGVTAGCNALDLGNFEKVDDPRETMPGPGVLANEQDGSALTWSTGQQKPAATAAATAATALDEKAEFEQFKKWNHLRSNAVQSAEYQEFLEWLKFQEFKAAE